MPQSLVLLLGRHTGEGRLLAPLDRIARRAFAGDGTIAHGVGEGLRFNAAGGRAGFSLGTWEPETQAALAEHLHVGDVFFDVGAATGFHTLIGARLVGPTGRVVAFEPTRENIATLRHNLNLNSSENVDVLTVALADKAGTAVMVPESTDEVSIVMKLVTNGSADENAVDVTTLDALLDAGRVPIPTLIKIDVEGVEIEVLKGATELIGAHHPTLLIEVHERWEELKAVLEAAGYRYRALEGIDPAVADQAVHVVATRKAG